MFLLFGLHGEIGKHDRLEIFSFTVISPSPIVSNCTVKKRKAGVPSQ